MSAIAADQGAYCHATALVVRETGLLLRGPSGVGKSSLAALLLGEARRDGCFARLVCDDRVWLAQRGDRLVARVHPAIAGRMERRTCGIVTTAFESACVIGLVVDLHAAACADLDRLPAHEATWVDLRGVRVPLLALRAPFDTLTCTTIFEKLCSAL